MKWAERLESGAYGFDPSQLRMDTPAGRLHCPLGVLADFLDPGGWVIAWDGTSGLAGGEQFRLPDAHRKRAKMKTTGLDEMTGLGVSFCDWVARHCRSHRDAAAFVRENYAVI